MSSADLAFLDAHAQAALVRKGNVTPLELVEAAIARIEKLNGELHTVIHPRFEQARAEAASPSLPDGPFRGVPIVVKDWDGTTAGDPFHGGNKLLPRDRQRRRARQLPLREAAALPDSSSSARRTSPSSASCR